MTDEDVRVMREQQRRESAERITGNPLLNERSPEDDEVVELVHE